ncbi:MAG: hypothetical protein A3B70_00835 [Deltaproteobacteria bacterium RIFCSPHIGHO2_02_FULL_40_11]|nr:MAG: hypothetical protein A3B70_00835 [Deltaproteobacteria bacterium RIFCSPHIGHO2_02_FULL_40_11]
MSKEEKAKFIDPLYVIFEKHLYDFQSEDLDLFIATIVNHYMEYLQKQAVIIPESKLSVLMKDLTEEVYDMFIKKVHGCLNLKDFQNSGRVTRLEKLLAQERFYKLAS